MRRAIFVIGLTFGAGACFLSPIPDARTPAERAAAMSGKCRSTDATLLSPAVIEAVEPDIVHVAGGPNGREARFRGARLRLAPSAGASHEAIERRLGCHEAAVVLGRVPPTENDPYALPGRWLDIDVESSGDGFVVHLQPERLEDAQAELDRARAFALQSAPASRTTPPLGQP